MYLLIYECIFRKGVNLELNESIYMIEGDVMKICVVNSDPEQAVERDIPFSLLVAHNSSSYSCKCSILCVICHDLYIL